jgi:hypothetical protein
VIVTRRPFFAALAASYSLALAHVELEGRVGWAAVRSAASVVVAILTSPAVFLLVDRDRALDVVAGEFTPHTPEWFALMARFAEVL